MHALFTFSCDNFPDRGGEEACPVDAIRMGPTYELANFDRSDFIFTKEELVKHGNFPQSRVKH